MYTDIEDDFPFSSILIPKISNQNEKLTKIITRRRVASALSTFDVILSEVIETALISGTLPRKGLVLPVVIKD